MLILGFSCIDLTIPELEYSFSMGKYAALAHSIASGLRNALGVVLLKLSASPRRRSNSSRLSELARQHAVYYI